MIPTHPSAVILRTLALGALFAAGALTPACAAPPAVAAAPVRPAPGVALLAEHRVLILGDSITQGGGYVSFMEYLLVRAYPEKRFDIVSAGLASETLSGLSEPGHAGGAFPRPQLKTRLARALGEVKPAVVLACYGMNDGIYLGYDESRMEAFRRGVRELADACAKAGAELVLVTPPVYDEWRAKNAYDTAVLSRFAEWELRSAPASVRHVVDLHTPMRAALLRRRETAPGFRFAPDLVHPDEAGHLFMALTLLKGLGVSVPPEPPEALLPRIKADPLWPEVNRRRQDRSTAWLNHIGYDREKHVAPGSGNIVAAEKTAEQRRLALAKLTRAK